MTTLELKKLLIHKITEIDDVSFLNEINTILESKIHVLLLSDEQKSEIFKSKEDIENGLFVEQEYLDQQISSWVSER